MKAAFHHPSVPAVDDMRTLPKYVKRSYLKTPEAYPWVMTDPDMTMSKKRHVLYSFSSAIVIHDFILGIREGMACRVHIRPLGYLSISYRIQNVSLCHDSENR